MVGVLIAPYAVLPPVEADIMFCFKSPSVALLDAQLSTTD